MPSDRGPACRHVPWRQPCTIPYFGMDQGETSEKGEDPPRNLARAGPYHALLVSVEGPHHPARSWPTKQQECRNQDAMMMCKNASLMFGMNSACCMRVRLWSDRDTLSVVASSRELSSEPSSEGP